jgi:hypothetical protein
MMSIKKIEKAVASALAYLTDAVDAEAKGDEDKVMQLTWRAASDLEYRLFLFALKSLKETRSSSWRLPASKQLEIELILASAQDLLKKAANNFEAGNQKEAYKKMWIARGQLLRIHDFFEKKRKTQKLSA